MPCSKRSDSDASLRSRSKLVQKYWLSDRPQPKRRSFPRGLARFAVLTALVVGGSAVLSHYHAGHGTSTYQGWTEE